ncbi:MAG: hypothetical protein ACLT2T_10955 [Bilophila wadsworthia]
MPSRLHGKRVLFGSRHYIHHDEGVRWTVCGRTLSVWPAKAARSSIWRWTETGRAHCH